MIFQQNKNNNKNMKTKQLSLIIVRINGRKNITIIIIIIGMSILSDIVRSRFLQWPLAHFGQFKTKY